MQNPLVTIAIPAYKSAYLSAAIRSALTQDYQNIELIVVDDCSPEDIKSVVSSFKNPRIRYVRNNVNLGSESVANNWNRCLDLAQGEYFVLLCDDDVLHPDMISSMLALAEAHPECGIFHANRTILKKSGELHDDDYWPAVESAEDFINAKFEGKRKHTITEFFYKTDFIRSERYAVFPVGYYSDDVTVLKLCMRQRKIISSNKPLVIFRESDIHITGSDKYNESKIRAFIQYYDYLQSCPTLANKISPTGYECILSQYLTHCNRKDILRLVAVLPHSKTMLKTILYLFFKR